MNSASGTTRNDLLVVCLCAQWCGVCREYRALFDQVRAEFPDVRFRWIDIEDESDLMEEVDVVDFPTLLVVRGGAPVFFGVLTPLVDRLERLVRTHSESAMLTPLQEQPLQALAARIRAGTQPRPQALG